MRSPDASLTGDDGFLETEDRGLTYPWGARTPEVGELIAIADGIGWVRIPMPGSLGHINCWVIDDAPSGALTIVDSGIRLPDCRAAWEALFAGPLEGRKVTRLIATHMHPDHIGLMGWLAERDGAPLHMTRQEWLTAKFVIADVQEAVPAAVLDFRRAAGWTEEQVAESAKEGWGRLRHVIHHMPHGYVRMEEGEILPLGDGQSWRVVVGSGHSPEHACLYNEAANILISGDQILPKISSNVSLGASEPMANPLGDWLASIDKLLGVLPEDVLVLPAHGEPFRGAHERLKALKTEHLERLDALVVHCAEAPRTAVDCFPILFNRVIGDSHRGLATGEALAHLRYLEVAGRVTSAMRDGVTWWQVA
ncbi:MBL fold metallo-hydrolase [Pseudonocardia sp. TMWB2A]|uniref:MBL fold metallo-hydrolase n=1 Tax=Pseudonocardia sp. TMWB2A TaxID=687430 RepID=UPI00307FA229